MAGLLASLDGLTVSVNLSATLQPQVNALAGVRAAVDALAAGPAPLADLEGAISQLPTPPALDGLGQLGTKFSAAGALVPPDLLGPLQGVLAPLQTLTQTLSVSPAGRITCVFEILREVMRLATGRSFGGPQGMPDSTAFPRPELTDIADIEALLTETRAQIDALGPAFDASRLLRMIQDTAPQFDRLLVRFPPIPVIQELMEALGTVGRWQTMSGGTLTRHLSETIATAARVIAMPNDRVVRPAVRAAELVSGAPATIVAVNAELAEIFAYLRPRILDGSVRLDAGHVSRLEQAALRMDEINGAMDPDASPLARCDDLVCALTTLRVAVLRAVQPGCALAPFSAHLEAYIAGLPPPDGDPFAEVVQAINEFDLSALTDPMRTIQEAAQTAVAEFNAARATVRDQIMALVQPVADALQAAIDAAGIADVQAALADLPGTIQSFADDEIAPNLTGVRDGISEAVASVSDLSDSFDPAALTTPIRDAIEEVGELVNNPEVKATFASVEQALNDAIDAIGAFDLAPASDQSIQLIGGIEAKLAEIDPSDIPDAAKPLIAQAVDVVASINFSVEVSGPLEAQITNAIEAGPDVVLGALEEGMEQARVSLEAFRPSVIIADTLDAPFRATLDKLRAVSPADLLGRLQAALDGVRARVQVLDVDAVIGPLSEIQGVVAGQLEVLRPSNLLKPVDEAIAAAIDKIYQISGIDAAFDGINDVFGEINRWVGVIERVRDLLARIAALLEAPGDASVQIDALVNSAVDRLDGVDLSALQASFAASAEAVRLTERDRVAGAIAGSFQAAGTVGVGLADGAEAVRFRTLVRAFPLDAARGLRPGPLRTRLVTAVERLRRAADGFDRAAAPWRSIGPRLVEKAGTIQVDLLDYHLAARLESGGILDSFASPPPTTTALKEQVRVALSGEIGPPLGLLFGAFGAFAPYVRLIVQGLSNTLAAVHAQIDGLVGAGGVTGTVAAVEEVANLLRELDLSPITAPLDELWARIEGVIGSVSPEALRAPLEAARDAVASLLDLSLLLDPADVQSLEQSYVQAVAKLETVAPSAAIGQPLDQEYMELLGTVLPILELPARLRARLRELGVSLSARVTAELERVEAAFDAMLQAIPARTGVEVSVSVGVSV